MSAQVHDVGSVVSFTPMTLPDVPECIGIATVVSHRSMWVINTDLRFVYLSGDGVPYLGASAASFGGTR